MKITRTQAVKLAPVMEPRTDGIFGTKFGGFEIDPTVHPEILSRLGKELLIHGRNPDSLVKDPRSIADSEGESGKVRSQRLKKQGFTDVTGLRGLCLGNHELWLVTKEIDNQMDLNKQENALIQKATLSAWGGKDGEAHGSEMHFDSRVGALYQSSFFSLHDGRAVTFKNGYYLTTKNRDLEIDGEVNPLILQRSSKESIYFSSMLLEINSVNADNIKKLGRDLKKRRFEEFPDPYSDSLLARYILYDKPNANWNPKSGTWLGMVQDLKAWQILTVSPDPSDKDVPKIELWTRMGELPPHRLYKKVSGQMPTSSSLGYP